MSTTIGIFVRQYIAERDLTPVYQHRLRKRAEKLARFAGSRRLEDIFVERRVNEYLASFGEISPATILSYRQDVLALWNGAADLDLVPYAIARRIRRVKVPKQRIECFTVDEVNAIVAEAEKCGRHRMRTERSGSHRRRTGITHNLYWPAIIRLAWDTGLRRSDCWRFRKSWIRPDGSAQVSQSKTGQVVTVRLHPSTIAALARIPFDKATEYPGGVSNGGRFGRLFKNIVRKAGVMHGTFKWLRRSSGSYVELAQPGSGGKHLGHSSPDVFASSYDAKLGGQIAPMPPELSGVVPETPSVSKAASASMFDGLDFI